MFKTAILLLLSIIYCKTIIAQDATDGTELVFSLLIHRHGDRTPIESYLSFSNNPTALEELSAPYGYGQLTDNQAALNCPTFITFMTSAMYNSYPDMQEKYADILALLTQKTGYNITAMPALTSAVYDVYISQLSLGLPIDDDVADVLDQIKEAAGAAFEVLYGDDEYKKYESGVLLNEFFTYSAEAIAGNDTQKLRIYSAHDVNVYSFKASTEAIPRGVVPKYASAYSLEVRKVTETGKYVVLPVYLPSPGEPEVYLQVEGCDDLLCDYDQFVEITGRNALDEATWRTECGFTEDIVIDDSSVA